MSYTVGNMAITNSKKTIAIMGASGFIGVHLTSYLLERTEHNLKLVSEHADSIVIPAEYEDRVQRVPLSIFQEMAVEQMLVGCDIAYYLVHMMAKRKGQMYKLEARSATLFGEAAAKASLKRIIFLGGLGDDSQKLSKHLTSRHNTGRILVKYVPSLIEFRASMVIGEGSIGYEIVRSLVRNLPVQTMPKWADTKTQPIALADALMYLGLAIDASSSGHDIVEIGGKKQLSYKEMVILYANHLGKKPRIIVVPIVPLWLGALWLNLFTPREHAKVGRPMVESLSSPMVVTNNRAQELFPQVKPIAIEKAF
jgi:uncharacterized protein YbjT (DUF2867 family)